MSTNLPEPIAFTMPPDSRIGVVAARFNSEIVDELIRGCLNRLRESGATDDQIDLIRVPGAFELPVAAKVMIDAGRVQAVICLGCVVRGDTPHFDFVAGEAARGIQAVATSTGRPVIFGVLTTNTQEQAIARIDSNGPHGHAGERAADAAVEMLHVCRSESDR